MYEHFKSFETFFEERLEFKCYLRVIARYFVIFTDLSI